MRVIIPCVGMSECLPPSYFPILPIAFKINGLDLLSAFLVSYSERSVFVGILLMVSRCCENMCLLCKIVAFRADGEKLCNFGFAQSPYDIKSD